MGRAPGALVQPRYGQAKTDRALAVCWKLDELTNAGDQVRLFDP